MRPRQPDHNEIGGKLDVVHDLLVELRDEVKDFTAMKPDLSEFLDIYKTGRGVFKAGKWAGKLVIWLGGLVAAIGGAIAVAKGWLPK